MSSRAETYYDIFLFAPDKMFAAQRILESILVEIKETLVKQKVSSYEAHGNVLVIYNSEWVKFVNLLNQRERRAVLRHDGLFRALLKLFPKEMPLIVQANPNVAKLMELYNIDVNNHYKLTTKG